jgi:hypothetical protein
VSNTEEYTSGGFLETWFIIRVEFDDDTLVGQIGHGSVLHALVSEHERYSVLIACSRRRAAHQSPARSSVAAREHYPEDGYRRRFGRFERVDDALGVVYFTDVEPPVVNQPSYRRIVPAPRHTVYGTVFGGPRHVQP